MENLAKYIDQTILKPEANYNDIKNFLTDVIEYGFHAAVVNPCWIEFIHKELPSDIKRCSVVGFPLGASTIQVKVSAAEDLIARGCDEIDMVMNIGYFKSKDYAYVASEIKSMVKAAQGGIVKVIIETCLLNESEKKEAAMLIFESGAHYVKTSTGFNKQGANVNDVRLIREVVGEEFGVKASGGIRDYETAVRMINAGANRIGTSAGVAIVNYRKTDDFSKKS